MESSQAFKFKRLIPQTGRAYHCQAITLLDICREIDRLEKHDKHERKIVVDALTVLTNAGNCSTSVEKEFVDVVHRHGLSESNVEKMKKAKERDEAGKARSAWVKARQLVQRASTAASRPDKVEVKVYNGTKALTDEQFVIMTKPFSGNQRLGVVLWTLAQHQYQHQQRFKVKLELSPNMYQFFRDQQLPEPLPYDEELNKIKTEAEGKHLDLFILVNRNNRLIVERPDNDSIILGNIYPGKDTIVMRHIGGKLEDVQDVLPGTRRLFSRKNVKETKIWRDLEKDLDDGCEDCIISVDKLLCMAPISSSSPTINISNSTVNDSTFNNVQGSQYRFTYKGSNGPPELSLSTQIPFPRSPLSPVLDSGLGSPLSLSANLHTSEQSTSPRTRRSDSAQLNGSARLRTNSDGTSTHYPSSSQRQNPTSLQADSCSSSANKEPVQPSPPKFPPNKANKEQSSPEKIPPDKANKESRPSPDKLPPDKTNKEPVQLSLGKPPLHKTNKEPVQPSPDKRVPDKTNKEPSPRMPPLDKTNKGPVESSPHKLSLDKTKKESVQPSPRNSSLDKTNKEPPPPPPNSTSHPTTADPPRAKGFWQRYVKPIIDPIFGGKKRR